MLLSADAFHLTPSNLPILAVINPRSGSGKALKIFENIVAPIWQKMGVSYDIMQTAYAGQCTKRLKDDSDITRYRSIIAIGGDGTLAEIVNGLIDHQWMRNAEKIISLGIIPVGSGNGLSKSLHVHANRKFTVQEAAKMTASAATQKLDLFEVTQNGKSRVGFLAVTLGLIADIDIILSEDLRFLGEFRYIIGAIRSIWHNRSYPATISYLPENSENVSKISGTFTLIMIGNTSHCSSNAHTSPGACLDDGYLHVTIIKKISRWPILKLLAKLGSGNWVDKDDPSFFQFRTKHLWLDELSANTTLTVDGEQIPPLPIECSVHNAALRILCSRSNS